MFVADTFNNAIRKVQQLGPDEGWLVSTVAGGGGRGFEDGVGSAARFFWPRGLAARASTPYVTEEGNGAIRMVDIASARVRTLRPELSFLESTFRLGAGV